MYTQLTKLIGKKFLYGGEVWLLVEIMRAEDALVLAPVKAAADKHIQPDQYGYATRRCHECITLPLTNTESGAYSDEVMELLSGRIADQT